LDGAVIDQDHAIASVHPSQDQFHVPLEDQSIIDWVVIVISNDRFKRRVGLLDAHLLLAWQRQKGWNETTYNLNASPMPESGFSLFDTLAQRSLCAIQFIGCRCNDQGTQLVRRLGFPFGPEEWRFHSRLPMQEYAAHASR